MYTVIKRTYVRIMLLHKTIIVYTVQKLYGLEPMLYKT
jgi:hypothetical protein